MRDRYRGVARVGRVVVFVNKADMPDPELVDLVVAATAAHLESQGNVGCPVIIGSGLTALRSPATDGACIRELVAALDAEIPDPKRDVDAPFMMPIEGAHTIAGRGTVVTGRFELHKPVRMDPDMRFAVREGGGTVGAGVIVSVECPRRVGGPVSHTLRPSRTLGPAPSSREPPALEPRALVMWLEYFAEKVGENHHGPDAQ